MFDTGIHESRIGWSSLEDWRVMAALSDAVSPDSVIARRTRPFNDRSRSFNVAAKSLPCCRSANAGEGRNVMSCWRTPNFLTWRSLWCCMSHHPSLSSPPPPTCSMLTSPSSSSPVSFSNQSSSDANSSRFSIKMLCWIASSHQSSSSNHSLHSGRTYKRSTFTIKKRIAHNVMAASKEDNMFSCKPREDRQLRNDKRPLKNILLNFLRHRNIDELLYSKIAYGVGIIVAFIRGHLSPKHAQQLATYAQQMKEFLGLMLSVCVKAIDETDGMVRNDYVKNAENGLINGIVAYLDRIERDRIASHRTGKWDKNAQHWLRVLIRYTIHTDAIESDESSPNRIHNYFWVLTPSKVTHPPQIESSSIFWVLTPLKLAKPPKSNPAWCLQLTSLT